MSNRNVVPPDIHGVVIVSKLDLFATQMLTEYETAREKFGPFNNGHEGLAVIWEEFEELKRFVFGKDQTEEQKDNARDECIQIAAMAMAFFVELL